MESARCSHAQQSMSGIVRIFGVAVSFSGASGKPPGAARRVQPGTAVEVKYRVQCSAVQSDRQKSL